MPYWLTAATYKVFGPSETVTRAIPLVFTFLSGLLIYLILLLKLDETAAMIGTLAFWLSPPVIIFAMSNNHIVFSLTTILLAVYLWLRYPQRFALVCTFTVLAMWTYWQAYFLPLVFACKEKRIRWLLLPAVSFITFLAFKYAMLPEPLELFTTMGNRSGIALGEFTPFDTFAILGNESIYLWGAIPLLVALIGFNRITFVLALCPVLYWLAMARIASLEPMFNTLMLAPAIAVAIAYGAKRLPQAAVLVVFMLAFNVSLHRNEWPDRLYNIYREDGYELTQRLIRLTKPGDTIFEHEHLIGPGRLAYYAWDRSVVVIPDEHPAGFIEGKSGYLVTAKPDTFLTVNKSEIGRFSVWHIYQLSEGSVALGGPAKAVH